MSKPVRNRVVRAPAPAENRRILKAAKQDPDAPPLTTRQLHKMVPVQVVRGRPKSASKKQLVSVRYSQDVIDYFRGTGDGWQSRMDGVLREYVRKMETKRGKPAERSGS